MVDVNFEFQIYGRLDRGSNNLEHFDWQHSYAHVYMNEEKYKSDGIFMSFEHYSVETRDRVKCISGIEGASIWFECIELDGVGYLEIGWSWVSRN